MTVNELVENLKKVHNQNAEILTIDEGGNILKGEGFGVSKVVEVSCSEDEDISNVYIVSD